MEKKLFSVRQKDAEELGLEGVNLNIKWLSKFYPQVSEYKALDSDFYIEYYVNSLTYEDDEAVINYSFFFVSEDEEVLVKFNVIYETIFDNLIDDTEIPNAGKRIISLFKGQIIYYWKNWII